MIDITFPNNHQFVLNYTENELNQITAYLREQKNLTLDLDQISSLIIHGDKFVNDKIKRLSIAEENRDSVYKLNQFILKTFIFDDTVYFQVSDDEIDKVDEPLLIEKTCRTVLSDFECKHVVFKHNKSNRNQIHQFVMSGSIKNQNTHYFIFIYLMIVDDVVKILSTDFIYDFTLHDITDKIGTRSDSDCIQFALNYFIKPLLADYFSKHPEFDSITIGKDNHELIQEQDLDLINMIFI